MRMLGAIVLMLMAVAARAEPEVQRFYGYAYDLKTNRYLYTEAHGQKTDGKRWLSGSIKYYAPDGAPLGNKTLDFSANPYVPLYRLDLPGEGYSEGIERIDAGALQMTRTERGKTETASLKMLPAMVADSGFHAYIVDHFEALQAGRTLHFTLAVAGQLTSYRFRAKKLGDTMFDGKSAVRIQIELDSLLRILADPLLLLYDEKQHRLLEFLGISNIHNPQTGDVYNVRIAYYDRPPADAPRNLPPLE